MVLLVTLGLNIYAVVPIDGVNLTISGYNDKLQQVPFLSGGAAAAAGGGAVVNSPVFETGAASIFSLNLLSTFPEDLEISGYCSDLLHIFGQRYVAYAKCMVPAARPVKVCQSCFSGYGSLLDIYTNISSDQVHVKYKVICLFLTISTWDPLWSSSLRPCVCVVVS